MDSVCLTRGLWRAPFNAGSKQPTNNAFLWVARRIQAFGLSAAWMACLYDTFIGSTLMYGAEIWGALSASNVAAADAFQNMVGLRILRLWPASSPS